MTKPLTPLADRLASRLQEQGACWVYTGSLNRDGYGQISAGGRGSAKLRVHRVAWEIQYGTIPAGLTIDHLCRNRACCNPAHMDVVPQGVNARRGHDATRADSCPQGHPFDSANTIRRADRNGARACRACRADYDRRRNANGGKP